jgi:hypothetical protein
MKLWTLASSNDLKILIFTSQLVETIDELILELKRINFSLLPGKSQLKRFSQFQTDQSKVNSLSNSLKIRRNVSDGN